MKGKFNYRLMGVHLVAGIFLVLGIKRFLLFYDIDFIQAYYQYQSPEFLNHLIDTDRSTASQRLLFFAWANILSGVFALLISFCISLCISLRLRIFWLNSFIVLIVGYAINRFDLLSEGFVKTIANSFGNLFISYGLSYAVAINATLLTAIGLFIYQNKWSRNFILGNEGASGSFAQSDTKQQTEIDINGLWIFEIVYGPSYREQQNQKLYFEGEIMCVDGSFTGTGKDVSGVGMSPDLATIQGFLQGNEISFRKQYAFSHANDGNGSVTVDKSLPGHEISYTGEYNKRTKSFSGEWEIIVRSKEIAYGEIDDTCGGTWTMKRKRKKYLPEV